MSRRDFDPDLIAQAASWLVAAALLLPLAFAPSAAFAQDTWSIRAFDVKLDLAREGTLDVTETIAAHFHAPSHGILREIDVRYDVNGTCTTSGSASTG